MRKYFKWLSLSNHMQSVNNSDLTEKPSTDWWCHPVCQHWPQHDCILNCGGTGTLRLQNICLVYGRLLSLHCVPKKTNSVAPWSNSLSNCSSRKVAINCRSSYFGPPYHKMNYAATNDSIHFFIEIEIHLESKLWIFPYRFRFIHTFRSARARAFGTRWARWDRFDLGVTKFRFFFAHSVIIVF